MTPESSPSSGTIAQTIQEAWHNESSLQKNRALDIGVLGSKFVDEPKADI